MVLDKVREIQAAIVALDAELQEFAKNNPDATEACIVLSEINFLKRDLSFAYDSYANSVISIMGDRENMLLNNGAEIEKKSSYDRKGWKHKELGSVVAQRITEMSVDMDTGEILKTPQEIALEILDYCAPSYWRIKELNKIGVNADNYCEVGDLRTSIIVRKSK